MNRLYRIPDILIRKILPLSVLAVMSAPGPHTICATIDANENIRTQDEGRDIGDLRRAFLMAKGLANFELSPGQKRSMYCFAGPREESVPKGMAAIYSADRNVTTLYPKALHTRPIEFMPGTIVHEDRHRDYAQKRGRNWRESLHAGRNLMFDRMINEGQAFLGEIEAVYVYGLVHGDNKFSDTSKWQPWYTIDTLTRLYNADVLKQYATQHNALPPLLARAAFVGAMQMLENIGYMDDFRADLMWNPHGAFMGPADGDLYTYMGVGDAAHHIGMMPGVTQFLLDNTVLGAPDRGPHGEWEAKLHRKVTADYVGILDDLADLALEIKDSSIGPRYTSGMHALSTSSELQYAFVRDDLHEGLGVLAETIRLNKRMPQDMKTRRLAMLHAAEVQLEAVARGYGTPFAPVRGAWLPGFPSNNGLDAD